MKKASDFIFFLIDYCVCKDKKLFNCLIRFAMLFLNFNNQQLGPGTNN